MYNQWHFITKAKPTEKGQYLVVANVKAYEKNKRHIFLNDFDGEHFSYDLMARGKGLPLIYAWSKIPEPPHFSGV